MDVILVVWEGVGIGARRGKCKMTHYACTSTVSGHLLSKPFTIPEPPKWPPFHHYFTNISPTFHPKLPETHLILGEF